MYFSPIISIGIMLKENKIGDCEIIESLFEQPHFPFPYFQIGGSLVIDLEGCTVQPAESDDRRFVFHIQNITDAKK